ncbi:MAG: Uma2 family endonuclease [Sphaerospermopsis sp. SIO1G2]|nr:Uma2 family endonuclease [Sphaerospermopsis sp. SIO1G1]NET70407.1 Uma2 family endonuclease [Sphaerospermopsis sp. SIO1G2]
MTTYESFETAKNKSISPEAPLDFELPREVIFPEKKATDEPPKLENISNLQQIILLIQCLELWWSNRNDFYAASNLTIHYSERQLKPEELPSPDFFVALNVERKPRQSWVIWQEDGIYPHIIIELLTEQRASSNQELRKQIYQNTFRTPEYFLFDPSNFELAGFILMGGTYQPIQVNEQGWLWSQQLNLYLGVHRQQLRYFTPEGLIILTPEEFAQQEKQKAERLAAKLRELGVDPDTI